MTVAAYDTWATNGHLIADVASLGYIDPEAPVFDATYGYGTFWSVYRPAGLVTNDLHAGEVFDGKPLPVCDFALDCTDADVLERGPGRWGPYQAVVWDPPYKLNGTPDPTVDRRYGVHEPTDWHNRLDLLIAAIGPLRTLLAPGGYLLVKCQDQVCSGAVRWQTDLVTDAAYAAGLDKIDRFDLAGKHRPQPEGRSQVHAHARPSTLLVFRAPKASER